MTDRTPRFVGPDDAEFPSSLRGLRQPVEGLWVIGCDLREMGASVAIVGARNATPYGLEIAYQLARDAADAGACVVSGMARGVDGAAHEGALAGRGVTVAVLGSGVDVPYPRTNVSLYDRIVDGGGAIVSEQRLGAKPLKAHFPLRNRIIAAITRATVLVEAKDHTSGACLTARLAVDLDRELFAVPGDVRADTSGGPHAFLREGAALCTGFGDLSVVLGLGGRSGEDEQWLDPPGLEPDALCLLRALSGVPMRADRAIAASGLEPVHGARLLGRLELKGFVRRAPSGEYRRIR